MKITNVEVVGFEYAKWASRLPMLNHGSGQEYLRKVVDYDVDKTNTRMLHLGQCDPGTGHDVSFGGITVYHTVKADIKWWVQAQRYGHYNFVSSTSTMKFLPSYTNESPMKQDCNEWVDEDIANKMQLLINIYRVNPTKENFYHMLYSCPYGYEYSAAMVTNYRQLKIMYNQRKNHKLDTWHTFCDWILTLPHFKEWCLKGENK